MIPALLRRFSGYDQCQVRLFPLLLASLMLYGCRSPSTTPAPENTHGTLVTVNCDSNPALINQVAQRLINVQRNNARMCGWRFSGSAGPVKYNPLLHQAATEYSGRMARLRFFSHHDPDGNTHRQRLDAVGYNWQISGENLAKGHNDLLDVIEAWINSPSHCSTLMAEGFRDFGIACAVDTEHPQVSQTQTYWTLLLASRRY